MFFLLRVAFWLGLVLVLLPRDKLTEGKQPAIGATEAVSAAGAAVSDMSQFCTRQPAACEVGAEAATALGQRAQDGARKLYRIIIDKKSPDYTGSIGDGSTADMAGSPDAQDAITRATAHAPDTLKQDDLQAPWSLPAASADASPDGAD